MSKELSPLEAFYELGDNTPITDTWKIVETALKRLETLEEENKLLRENVENLDETYFDTWYACERLKKNSNYALMFVDGSYCLVNTKDNKFDVIDSYKVNNKGIIDNGTQKKLEALERYVHQFNHDTLTQEEYDILKEELLCKK